MFSPYYAHARHIASDGADPLEHCAINVALYGKARRWTMTERRAGQVMRDATTLRIGPSAIVADATTWRFDLDEIAAPVPRPVRGTITVQLGSRPDHGVALDAEGRHRWGVIAPLARVEVVLDAPKLAWSGPAYLDGNRGSRPLERDFMRWNWSRAHRADGRTAVLYDVERRDGSSLGIAQWFDAKGSHGGFEAPAMAALPKTGWGLSPASRTDQGSSPSVSMQLEDGPFYSRAVIDARWDGEPVRSVHEHLSLERFEQRWVRALLPFRMPRRFV